MTSWRPEDEPEGDASEAVPEPTLSGSLDETPEAVVVRRMREDGVDLREPLEVTHYLYARSRRSARRFARLVERKGVTTHIARLAADERSWLITVSWPTLIEEEALARIRANLVDLAMQAGVEYDGWEVAS